MNEQHGAHTPGDATGRELALLLYCFDQPKAARRARRHLDGGLRRAGDQVLDTVIMEVNAKNTASVHDPRRDTAGALIAEK